MSAARFVAVVGPGGIGKTRVAIEACIRLMEKPGPRVSFVDFAPLSAGEFVASAVAAALAADDAGQVSPVEKIVQSLRQGRTLLVLDSCEHVLDDAAELSEELLRAVPDLSILATSREPLLVEGEVTVRLDGLGGPEGPSDPMALEEALAYPAVELFVERAVAGDDKLSFANSDARCWPRSADVSTAFRLPSNWRRRALPRWGFTGLGPSSRPIQHNFGGTPDRAYRGIAR